MGISYWRELGFSPAATWSGGTWGSGNYTDGGTSALIAPADQIVSQLVYKLRSDSTLQGSFGDDRIMRMEAGPRAVEDVSNLPRVFVWSGTQTVDEIPTTASDHAISVYVGLAYSLRSIKSLDLGEPSLATPLHRILVVVQANRELQVTVDSQEEILADLAQMQPHDTLDLRDDQGRPFAEMQIFHCVYTVRVSTDTGRIWNLEAAGA